MATFRIYDPKDQVISVDLGYLFRLLAPRSLRATWIVSTVKSLDPDTKWFEATGESSDQLEILAQKNVPVPGSELLALAEKARQIIWGEFVASLPGRQDEKWVTIRAIDSSFYEITTLDEVVLEKLGATYGDIRPAEPWFV